jgi:hypothetical protein
MQKLKSEQNKVVNWGWLAEWIMQMWIDGWLDG